MVADRTIGSESAVAYDPSASVRRSLLSRIKLGHVVMALAALFALIFNIAVLRANESTVEVAVASTDIRAGTTLTISHFTTAEVPADDLLTSRFVLVEAMGGTVGQLTTRSIAAGQPVLESDLLVVESRDGLRAMSIPIDQTRAVAGHLSAGDSIDVVLVVDGVATYIATAIQVMSVPEAGTNALGARSGYAPTVAVTAAEALRIAAALDTGEVHIVRSTGSAVPDLEQATAIEQEEPEGSSG
jgi:Flp pilus assembly protein CpaB